MHFDWLCSSRKMVPSPMLEFALKTPPLRMTYTSASKTSWSIGTLKVSTHSNFPMRVSQILSLYFRTILEVSFLSGFSRSSSPVISSQNLRYLLNSSIDSSLWSPLEPREPLELADLTDFTSFNPSLLLSFVISSMAFSISAVRKLFGSDTSSSSFSSRLNLPPSFWISLSNFSISSFSSFEFSSWKISSKFLLSRSSQPRFLKLISSLRISIVRAVPSSSGRSLSNSSQSSFFQILLCTLSSGSFPNSSLLLGTYSFSFAAESNCWNYRTPSMILSRQLTVQSLSFSVSSFVCLARISLRLRQLAKFYQNSLVRPILRQNNALC